MPGRLAGKVALITGGGAGIGAATAALFCAEGAALVLVDSDAAALSRTQTAIRSATPQARIAVHAADVANGGGAAAGVAAAVREFGGLDVLVCNAAMRNYSAVADATPEEWRQVIDVNLVGAAQYARAAIPALRRSGRGSIVLVSSCYALTGRKGMAIYDATKAGLISLARTLAHEEAAHGIRANAVCPGSTLTDFHIERGRARGVGIAELKKQREDNSLLARWADPLEIARPILWLASDEASFITGTHLLVDGGLAIY
ncbi:MAG: SDR family oxidoreductase [Betaproteobacteria bacterium]|nr:SDR family oxidoreductase [Betaproteobacteria bacterium]